MKLIFLLCSLLLLSAVLQAEQEKEKSNGNTVIYPNDLHSLSFELKLIADIASSGELKEFVEVDSNLYPGLDLELSQPDQLLNFRKFELKTPPPGPGYFQPGGSVLYYYGIYMPSGQLVTVSLPFKLKKQQE